MGLGLYCGPEKAQVSFVQLGGLRSPPADLGAGGWFWGHGAELVLTEEGGRHPTSHTLTREPDQQGPVPQRDECRGLEWEEGGLMVPVGLGWVSAEGLANSWKLFSGCRDQVQVFQGSSAPQHATCVAKCGQGGVLFL